MYEFREEVIFFLSPGDVLTVKFPLPAYPYAIANILNFGIIMCIPGAAA